MQTVQIPGLMAITINKKTLVRTYLKSKWVISSVYYMMVMIHVIVSDLIECAHLDLTVNHLHNMLSPKDAGNQFYRPNLLECFVFWPVRRSKQRHGKNYHPPILLSILRFHPSTIRVNNTFKCQVGLYFNELYFVELKICGEDPFFYQPRIWLS